MSNRPPFSKKYQRFFAATADERHVFLQGGRRSGKTFATLLHLFILTSFIIYSGEAKSVTVMVVCSQYSQLQSTMIDFEKALGVRIAGNKALGDHATTCNGRVLWQFKSFDDATKVQGTQCDYTFFNEAPNIPEDVARVQMMSTRVQCFYNFNPTRKFWGQAYMTDGNTLCTTFRDNSYLTDLQREEFEAIREKALKPTARKIDTYQYKVYYLGEFSELTGNVFGGILRCSAADYFNVPAREAIGLDFGFATEGDPTVCVGVKIHERRLYIHEYIYERGLINDGDLASRFEACGFNPYTVIFADYGGMGRTRMDNLVRHHGYTIRNAVKGSIMEGINAMLAAGDIVVTDCSAATAEEFENYELLENGRPHGDDHAIDAARYAFNYLNRLT